MPLDKGRRPRAADGGSAAPVSASFNPPRKLTAVACVDCRKRKRKCNGHRPACSACQTRGLACQYDVIEGATRTEDLKQKVHSLTARTRDLETFVNKLRYGTDNEASAILAQLRLGDSVETILGVESVNSSDSMELDGWKPQRRHSEQGLEGRRESWTLSKMEAETSADILDALTPSTLARFEDAALETETPTAAVSSSIRANICESRGSLRKPQDHQGSPWAIPLFVGNGSQLHLPEEQSQSEPIGSMWDQCTVETESPSSSHFSVQGRSRETTGSLFDREMLPDGGYARVSGRQARLEARWKARHHFFNERNVAGDLVTISSHLLRGIAAIPLSISMEMLSPSVQDLPAPAWAVKSMHKPDGDVACSAYTQFIKEKRTMIDDGVPPERIFGTAPEIEALLNEGAFRRATCLSRWTAQWANSFGIPSMTCRMALMWLSWHLMRWLIHPTPATYAEVPEWYRPTPYQLLFIHPVYLDFQIWPLFRDMAIQRMDLQSQSRHWPSEAAKTVDCNWPDTLEEALCYDGSTGRLALNVAFVQHISDLSNWTMGPIIRKYVPDADSFMQIRYGSA